MVSLNRLSAEKRRAVIACLVEGNSIRATVRMTGVAKNTVTKLLVDMGTVCSVMQDHTLRDLSCQRVQCDEIWAFVGSKQKNVPAGKENEYGDVWTWVAMDADTKLVPTFRVGSRGLQEAYEFVGDLSRRLANRIQLSTDGYSFYVNAVDAAFGSEVDYGQIVKHYAASQQGRYSPPECIGQEIRVVRGNPDPEQISTSFIERQNLTMRMSMRRYTRLTNAFSKKIEDLAAAVSLHFAHYNFCRVHQSLGVTPAMAAGVTDHVWKLDDLVALLVQAEDTPIIRGPYAKTSRATRLPGENST